MATEQAEVAEATKVDKAPSGLGKTIGMAVGLFFMVITAQLLTSIVGCMVMPGLMPGCTQHLDEADAEKEQAAEKESKKKAKKDEPKPPPVYLAFDPPLVISFQDQSTMRFLQATVEVMARDEESINAVKLHMPVIRNNLLNTLSGRSLAELTSREGREALRLASLAEVKRVLKTNADKEHPVNVEDLYFTSFVVQ